MATLKSFPWLVLGTFMLSRAIFDGLVQTSYESDRETTSGCESREQRQTKREFPYFCRKRVFRAWPLNIVLDYNSPTFAGVIWVLRVSSAYLLPNKALLLSSPCCHNEYCFQAWNDGDNHQMNPIPDKHHRLVLWPTPGRNNTFTVAGTTFKKVPPSGLVSWN